MTTSFSTTGNDLIKGALRLVGVLAQGEEPSSAQTSEALVALNYLLKSWVVDGLHLWKHRRDTITLVDGTVTYTLSDPKAYTVTQVWINNTSNTSIPLRMISRQEYFRLSNRASNGTPSQVYVDKQKDSTLLYVYPVPDATTASLYNMEVSYTTTFDDLNTVSDIPDFPQEWYDAIKYGLAVRLAGEYNISTELRRELKAEAREFKEQVLSFGAEDSSIYFGLDYRGF